MKQPLLEPFEKLTQGQFRDIEGAVLAFLPGSQQFVAEAVPSGAMAKAQYENEFNHQHFDLSIGNSVWERWKNNLILASTVLQVWRMQLRATFPERQFILFIYNELSFTSDGQGAFEIVPTLRMWSKENDPEGEMHRGFRVDQARTDHIEVRVNRRPKIHIREHPFYRGRSDPKAVPGEAPHINARCTHQVVGKESRRATGGGHWMR